MRRHVVSCLDRKSNSVNRNPDLIGHFELYRWGPELYVSVELHNPIGHAQCSLGVLTSLGQMPVRNSQMAQSQRSDLVDRAYSPHHASLRALSLVVALRSQWTFRTPRQAESRLPWKRHAP